MRQSGNGITVWRLITHHERPNDAADWSRRKGIIAIGWGLTGDLRQCHFRSQDQLTRVVSEAYPGSPGANRAHGGQSLCRLFSQVEVGDLVILSNRGSRVAVMRVTGEYYFNANDTPRYYEHRRNAEWVPLDAEQLWQTSGKRAQGEDPRSTLVRCSRALTQAEFDTLVA